MTRLRHQPQPDLLALLQTANLERQGPAVQQWTRVSRWAPRLQRRRAGHPPACRGTAHHRLAAATRRDLARSPRVQTSSCKLLSVYILHEARTLADGCAGRRPPFPWCWPMPSGTRPDRQSSPAPGWPYARPVRRLALRDGPTARLGVGGGRCPSSGLHEALSVSPTPFARPRRPRRLGAASCGGGPGRFVADCSAPVSAGPPVSAPGSPPPSAIPFCSYADFRCRSDTGTASAARPPVGAIRPGIGAAVPGRLPPGLRRPARVRRQVNGNLSFAFARPVPSGPASSAVSPSAWATAPTNCCPADGQSSLLHAAPQ